MKVTRVFALRMLFRESVTARSLPQGSRNRACGDATGRKFPSRWLAAVVLAVPDYCCEGQPGIRAEREDRAVRILAVTDLDGRSGVPGLDTIAALRV
jgi:hypothetical protein